MYDALLNEIKQNRLKNVPLVMELCDQLYTLGKENGNNEMIGAAFFYKAESLFYQDPNEAESYAIMSQQYLKEEDSPELLARLYNIQGIMCSNKDDLVTSLDHFIKCDKLCSKYNLYYIKGLCACNTGMNFQFLECYDKAIEYYEEALRCIDLDSNSNRDLASIVNIYSNMFVCYYHLYDEAESLNCLNILIENKAVIGQKFLLPLFESQYYQLVGESEKMNNKISATIEQALTTENVLACIDEYMSLCELLHKVKRFAALIKVLDWIDAHIAPDDVPRIRANLLKYRLKCIAEQRDFEEYVKWSEEYIRTVDLINDNYHLSVVNSAEQRLYIDKLEAEENKQEENALHDELTQLYNRQGLDTYMEPIFRKAAEEKTPISYYIIDIDYFKQINDSYGHTYGNQCIQSVADILSGLESKDTIVGRIDSDKFVIMNIGYSFEESDELAASIKDYVEALAIESSVSAVSDVMTVSIGVYFGIPEINDTLSAFMSSADAELLTAKENGRNQYSIGY